MPNSRCVSISSRPLFTSVAEFRVFIGPIDQVGWAPACSGVTDSSRSAGQPRNGPPEAVSTSRATSSGLPPRRHWASAECSESTGTIWPGAAAAVTSAPPATSDSLLASARRAPVASAASVGSRPRDPTRALSTTSASTSRTSRVTASGPLRTCRPGTSSRAAACAFATATSATPVTRICAASRSMLPPPAARPTTSNRSGLAAITSRAWVPMEPVLPSSRTRVRELGCESTTPTLSPTVLRGC